MCLSVRLSVCLFFLHDVSKRDTARFTKLDREMFQDESRKPVYLIQNIAGVGNGAVLRYDTNTMIRTVYLHALKS